MKVNRPQTHLNETQHLIQLSLVGKRRDDTQKCKWTDYHHSIIIIYDSDTDAFCLKLWQEIS